MLTGFIFMWLVTATELWIATFVVPGVRATTLGGLLWTALILGLVNAFTLWLSAAMVKNFEIDSFGSALLAAVVMALLGVMGFILMTWLMMGEVDWMMYQGQSGSYGHF